MTPEQRQAVVEARRARGFPLHKPPHTPAGFGWYLITAATYEHRRHFRAANELTALTQRLLEAFQMKALPVAGWVVLPNHYHILVQLSRATEAGVAIGPVHGRSARYANQRDDTPGRQVWYKYSDRKVRSERHYWTCVHYTMWNPVKHGYVKAMTAWPWSCFHELLVAHGPDWIEDLRREYPLCDFGKNWDEAD